MSVQWSYHWRVGVWMVGWVSQEGERVVGGQAEGHIGSWVMGSCHIYCRQRRGGHHRREVTGVVAPPLIICRATTSTPEVMPVGLVLASYTRDRAREMMMMITYFLSPIQPQFLPKLNRQKSPSGISVHLKYAITIIGPMKLHGPRSLINNNYRIRGH